MIQQASLRLQLDQEIDIAVRACLTARNRTDHANMMRSVLVCDLEDFFSFIFVMPTMWRVSLSRYFTVEDF